MRAKRPKEETDVFVLVFPRLKGVDIMITDEATGRYNCFSYAINCNSISGWYNPKADGREKQIQDDLAAAGWVKSADCEHKKGFRKIAIYDDAGPQSKQSFWVHAAKENASGDGWVSKDGEGARFTHPSPESLLPPKGKEAELHWKFRYLCCCYEEPLADVLKSLRETLAAIDKRLPNEPDNQSLKDARTDTLREIDDTEQQIAKDAQ